MCKCGILCGTFNNIKNHLLFSAGKMASDHPGFGMAKSAFNLAKSVQQGKPIAEVLSERYVIR